MLIVGQVINKDENHQIFIFFSRAIQTTRTLENLLLVQQVTFTKQLPSVFK